MKKIILYCIGVFLLSTLLITIWYVTDIASSEPNINFDSIKNIAVRFGFYGATLFTILFLIGYLLFTKVTNKIVLVLGTLSLIILLWLACGWFLWYVGINGLVENPVVE